MLEESTIKWTVKKIYQEMEENNISFDNAIQRNLVWKLEQKTLLIDSLLRGYPIPPMYANRITETKILDMLDGKQRSNTIVSYIKGEFALNKESLPIENKEEDVIIADCTFQDLPEFLKDKIFDRTIEIVMYNDMTDDEIMELVCRLNNGKSFSNVEKVLAASKSRDTIIEISKHKIRDCLFTMNMLNGYADREMVIKTYCILYEENPTFEKKYLNKIMQSAIILEEQKNDIINIYNKFLEVYTILENRVLEEKEANAKRNFVLKTIKTKTHFTSLIQILKNTNISSAEIASFCMYFYKKGTTSISPAYNKNLSNRTATSVAVKTRLEEIFKYYDIFLNNISDETKDIIWAETINKRDIVNIDNESI